MKEIINVNETENMNLDTCSNEETIFKENTKSKKNRKMKKYSDDEVDMIVNKKLSEWKKKQKKLISEIKKIEKMNSRHFIELERQKFQKELSYLRNKDVIYEMIKQTNSLFKEKGINISNELLDILTLEIDTSSEIIVKQFISIFDEQSKRNNANAFI